MAAEFSGTASTPLMAEEVKPLPLLQIDIADKDFTPKLSDDARVALEVQAEIEERTVGHVVVRLLNEWGSKEVARAHALTRAMEEISPRAKPQNGSSDPSEKEAETDLAAILTGRGLNVRTQYDTRVGIADIVLIDADDKPRLTIEVKRSITSWRDLHAACGQACAYAKALKTKGMVTAPDIDGRFIGMVIAGVRVLAFDDAAALNI